MSNVDPAQLKATAETLLADAKTVLQLVDDLPLPAQVKSFVEDAETFVSDVQAFLSA
jgi:hypothetical protein